MWLIYFLCVKELDALCLKGEEEERSPTLQHAETRTERTEL